MSREEKLREARRKYKLMYPDRVRESKEAYRKSNLAKWREYTKAWTESNPEKAKESSERYYKTEKGKENIRRKNYKRKALTKSVSDYSRTDLYERFFGICQLCLERIDPTLPPRHSLSLTVDHIIPLSVGGGDCFNNVWIAHYSCNSRKGCRIG